MPIYGYRCKQCDHEFEIVQRMSDDPLKTCPECMGPLQKQLYPAGIVFKGSGFYKTDYASASSKSTEGSESSTSTANGGGDSKPAAGKSEGAAAPAAKSAEAPKSESKKESKSESSGSKE